MQEVYFDFIINEKKMYAFIILKKVNKNSKKLWKIIK